METANTYISRSTATPSTFDVMANDRVDDRAAFVKTAEDVSNIKLPVAMTARGEQLMADLERELQELEDSIFQRIQKI